MFGDLAGCQEREHCLRDMFRGYQQAAELQETRSEIWTARKRSYTSRTSLESGHCAFAVYDTVSYSLGKEVPTAMKVAVSAYRACWTLFPTASSASDVDSDVAGPFLAPGQLLQL